MEVEDPVSSKFRTLVESLMMKTTSEIVKVFAEVLLETRLEISRSWREIDELKQKLEESEEHRAEAVVTSPATCSFKRENEQFLVTHQIAISEASMVTPGDRRSKVSVPTSKETPFGNAVGHTSDVVAKLAIPQTSIDAFVIRPLLNSSNNIQEAQHSHLAGKRKRGRAAKMFRATENQASSISVTKVLSDPSPKGDTAVTHQQSSSNTDIIILGKRSRKKDGVVTKKNYIQRKYASLGRVSNTHRLRDRQLLSPQRPCLCCSSDQCSRLLNQPKSHLAPRVYTCKKCEKKFNEFTQFKSHECSDIYECNRCGQVFGELKHLATHRRNVHQSLKPFPYCCYLCGQQFATQCGWNLHKRFHTYSDVSQKTQQETSNTSKSFTFPKELKANLEVRLERISNAQLEAALSPKGFMLHDETPSVSSLVSLKNLSSKDENKSGEAANLSSTETVADAPVPCKESASQTVTKGVTQSLACMSPAKIDESVKRSDNEPEHLIPTASCQTEPAENKTLTEHKAASVTSDEASSTSEESINETNSHSKKRKMSDCDHDAYNGVFPVEKILGWRNTKGRNEVRVKWMPCSLCGAKWKNTWEPAECFTSYKDSKSEEHKNVDQTN